MKFENAKKYKKEIKKLYRTAFPKNERAPLFLLFKKADNENNSFYAVLDNEEFIGLVYTIRSEKLSYVFFLAVSEEKRGKGYGTRILAKIKEMHPDKPVTLEIEDTEDINAENLDERIKRLKFYETNGFERLHIKVNEAGVVFELLGTEKNVTREDFLALMKEYLGSYLFKLVYRKNKM